MYQYDSTKRYNVSAHNFPNSTSFNNVELVYVDHNLVVIRDENGKEHILTGNMSICIDEV